MKNLLVGVDFTELGEAVLAKAVELAKWLDARLYLLHVAAPEPDFVSLETGPVTMRHATADDRRQEHRLLGEIAAKLQAQGVSAEALLVQGSAASKIIEHAQRLESLAIVLGTHGRGAMYQLLVGSVTEAVLRQADRPVIVIPVKR